jgi:hypothetical protein
MHTNNHVSNCEQTLVKCQDGEFHERHATGVDEVIGVSDLISVNMCAKIGIAGGVPGSKKSDSWVESW